MKSPRILVAAVVALALFGALLPNAASQQDSYFFADDPVSIFRVPISGQADIDTLLNGGFDLVESRGADYLLVVGDNAVAAKLRTLGFTVEQERQLNALDGAAGRSIYYGGYRTVDEHYAHLDDVEATYPNLAQVVDYGDSWRALNGQPGGNELLAICLTNIQPGDCALNPNSAKPRAVIMAAIHARELQTSEIAWRLIDELTQQYDNDADITYLMDTTEVWIIPVMNPDGREIVEGGGNAPYLQRKNANNSVGNCAVPPTSSNQHGVDLNRNASYQWGGVGTTTNSCAQTYRGTSPASEPEQASLQALFSNLWPDQKSGPQSPVSANATGTFITMHSYGELILLPPGAGGVTPNDAELRSFAFRMSHYNNYVTGTGPEILYGVTGSTDDWVYGQLGVASFTYELSPRFGVCSGFTPAYACVDSSIWPTNREALLYSIRVAGAPYQLPLGPTIMRVGAPARVTQGSNFEINARANDNALGNAAGSVGRPSPSDITDVEYYFDVGPSQGGTPFAMSAADGNFNIANEKAVATATSAALTPGEHLILVRARNEAGYWGPIMARSITVEAGPNVSSEFAVREQAIRGTVTGNISDTFAADGVSQTITEVYTSAAVPRRSDRANHQWTISAGSGDQTLVIVASATDGGDADEGFVIEWKTGSGLWTELATVQAGSPVDAAFPIGAPTEPIRVRIQDTNRARGEDQLDSVSVDLLRVDAG